MTTNVDGVNTTRASHAASGGDASACAGDSLSAVTWDTLLFVCSIILFCVVSREQRQSLGQIFPGVESI